MSMDNKTRLNNLVKVAGKISGRSQVQLVDFYNRQVLRKATSVLLCSDHPLFNDFQLLPSGRRYKMTAVKTKRHKLSFVPSAIILINNTKL